LLHCTKDELVDDFQSAPTEAESALYSKVFNRYDAFGAKPIGAIVGDFEFANTSDDIYLLKQLSKVGAANHCPILTAVSPAMFKYDRWEQIAGDSNPIDIFDRKAYIEWKSFRQSADSKYVTLTMPRVLARLPYSRASNRTSEFAFDEIERNSKDGSLVISTENFVWMNAAYALAGCMTRSFYDYGLCTAIRGVENGGVVDNLPVYTYTTEDGDVDQLCPTEVAIGGKLEYDLSKAGIMALCHHTESDKAVFYSSQTANKPQEFGDEKRRSVEETQATANAAICARLTYLMVVSRFSHYLKAIARDKIGSPKDRADLEKCLDGWLANYRCSAATPSDTEKRTKPLRDYSVTVEGIPGRPGCYQAVMYLRPWLGLEELTVSMRVVNELPNSAARQ
jgi:type VI secretion system protein ImpC